MTRCTINRNGQTGLLVSDSDTYATAVDCAISENDRRGVTAQHQGAFQLRGCNVTSNRDLGVLLLGDASPCTCLFVNSNITGNSEGALTIHGSVPDTSSCHIEGEVKLLHTPPARPSPIEPARQFAGLHLYVCSLPVLCSLEYLEDWDKRGVSLLSNCRGSVLSCSRAFERLECQG